MQNVEGTRLQNVWDVWDVWDGLDDSAKPRISQNTWTTAWTMVWTRWMGWMDKTSQRSGISRVLRTQGVKRIILDNAPPKAP